MWAEIEFTHHNGVKLGKGQQHPRGRLHGEIQSFMAGRSSALQIKPDPHSSPSAIMVAVQLVGIGPDVVHVSGLERRGDAWVRQQWICRLESRPHEDRVMYRPEPFAQSREEPWS